MVIFLLHDYFCGVIILTVSKPTADLVMMSKTLSYESCCKPKQQLKQRNVVKC